MKRTCCFAAGLLLALASCGGNRQAALNIVDGMLPRADSTHTGFDSAAIEAFYAAADTIRFGEFHSIMVLHRGKVVAEKWWDAAAPGIPHTMYSVSKSFTAAGVGFARHEGLLSLDDKVVSFFPDKVPEDNPLIREITVRDLLVMSTGQREQSSRIGDDWISDFMNNPVADQPGTVFRYNSMATFMLSAIVQAVSGKKLFDYLRPRLFRPLEIEGIEWEENSQGMTVGGWGLRLKTEDMAKFGQLFLQKGVWNGEQLLPPGWVEEASSWKIASGPSGNETMQDPDSDWTQGYCYQMWRSRHNAYRADGAWGQYIIVIPHKEAVVAITAHMSDMQAEINMVWDYILPAFE